MSERFEFYYQQARASRSSIPWLAELQADALRDFRKLDFPSKKNEEWKYTALDKFFQECFVDEAKDNLPYQNLPFALPHCRQWSIYGGQVVEKDESIPLPPGVIIEPLLLALQKHGPKIEPYLGQLLKHEHGFQALNTASLKTGLVIYLPRGVKIQEPIALVHWNADPHHATHLRHLIIAEEHSEASIIEVYKGKEGSAYFTNSITEVSVGRHASISHYKIQCESEAAFHLGHIAVHQHFASHFTSHSLSLGGLLVRSDLSIYLQEEEAYCLLNGIYAPRNSQHVDHHTTIHHLVPRCQSEQDYKGILMGKSRAVFNGKVLVAKGAEHTDAQQQNKNLLLSSEAEVNTKPQLEIFADDVICSHGATVGQLDENALFYLRSRGISQEEAAHYLIEAFALDNLKQVPNSSLATWMTALLLSQVRLT